jgi:DNA polymerase III alpha subunit
MADFLDRVQPDENETRALIHCGALDKLDPKRSRTRLLWVLARWQSARRRTKPQTDLFARHAKGIFDIPPPDFPPTDPSHGFAVNLPFSAFCAAGTPLCCLQTPSYPKRRQKPLNCPQKENRLTANG